MATMHSTAAELPQRLRGLGRQLLSLVVLALAIAVFAVAGMDRGWISTQPIAPTLRAFASILLLLALSATAVACAIVFFLNRLAYRTVVGVPDWTREQVLGSVQRIRATLPSGGEAVDVPTFRRLLRSARSGPRPGRAVERSRLARLVSGWQERLVGTYTARVLSKAFLAGMPLQAGRGITSAALDHYAQKALPGLVAAQIARRLLIAQVISGGIVAVVLLLGVMGFAAS